MVRQKVIIYFLKCPLTNKVRYIGKTSEDLNKRLRAHMSNQPKSSTKEKSDWINELKSRGLTAIIVPIEKVYSRTEATLLEDKWILHLRTNGIRIYNSKRLSRHRPIID